MPRTSGAYDFEILLADTTTWLGLMLAPQKPLSGLVAPKGFASGVARAVGEELAAAVGGDPSSQDLVARVQEDWSGGVGVSYNAAYSVYTRSEGYAMPAGLATNLVLPAGGHPSNSPLVAFAEFNGNLYIAQQGDATNGGRVLRIAAGSGFTTGTVTEDYFLAGGDLIRDLLVADDGSGNTVLYASSESATHTNGRLHRYALTPSPAWTATTAGTEFAASRGLGRLAYVYWRTSDGNGGWRIVAITGQKTVAYTFPFVNPQGTIGTAGSATAVWCPDIRIGTSGSLIAPVAQRRHVYFGASDDLYDIDEMGDSQQMTGYLRRMLQTGNGYAVETLNSYIYLAVGRGLIRVYVGDGHFDESPLEGQCAPGWGTPAENEGRGYVTALCVDQGYLVAAVYNDSTKRSYIYWGMDRKNAPAPVKTNNPLIWYGPEVCIGQTTSGWRVTRMQSSGLAGDLRLWVCSEPTTGTLPGVPRLDFVSIPIAGSPIQDLLVGGLHRFARGNNPTDVLQPLCSLESLPDGGTDKANASYIYQHTIGSRGLDIGTGTKLTLWERADPTPAPVDAVPWTNQGDVTHGPTQDMLPVAPPLVPILSGHKLQYRIDFISPIGAGALGVVRAAVLDSVRTLVWERAPTFAVVRLPVQFGDGVMNCHGGLDSEVAPDWKSAELKKLADGGQTVLRDRNDQQWNVALRQVYDGATEYVDAGMWGKRVVKHLEIQVIGPVAT